MPTTPDDRFAPHAARELGGMFDEVSPRYDLLNRLLSLGQDRAWRAALARAVPENARAVLDLCTGSGVSLRGLRRPGRLLLGADVSPRMLEIAAGMEESAGWAPRLIAANAFRLPLRDRSLDAVTIAFGIRNLRPTTDALAELARVMRPGGTLAVLEASAPAGGPLAPAHAFYLRHVVPFAGRLSGDPSAYVYLSRSIFAFGSGPEFESALRGAGFSVSARRRFLLGATRLWVARLGPGPDGNLAAAGAATMQSARARERSGANDPGARRAETEWRAWSMAQMGVAAALAAALAWGTFELGKYGAALPLEDWQRRGAWLLLAGGAAAFAFRALALLWRLVTGASRR
jgi:demethylmenaquinone methyltransferase/2-methoxy-6-polyprenyl-1,4-benzoquinol methylase